jgi:Catalase
MPKAGDIWNVHDNSRHHKVHQGSDLFEDWKADAYVRALFHRRRGTGAADAERDIRGTALKFYTEDGRMGHCRKQYSGLFLSRSSKLL